MSRVDSTYNMGLEFTSMQGKAFDQMEQKILHTLDDLRSVNEDLRALQELSARLAQAKKEKKKVDFNEDVHMQHTIDRVRELNPTVFKELTYQIEVDQIEDLLTSCKEMTTERMTEANRIGSYVSLYYQDRIQMTDISQKALDLLIREYNIFVSNQKASGG